MSLFSVVLFFVYLWGLGFSLGKLVKESENFLERNLMRLGIGLSAFIVLGIALNALRVPLDYRVFLLFSIAVPAFAFLRGGYKDIRHSIRLPSLRLKASDVTAILMLSIFFLAFFMYVSGAFSYPYLEDDDPWSHARGIKYVAVEKTGFANPYLNSQYIDPYPPSYDILFGILHQVSGSIYWTMKFFNAMIISLSIIFFYFFAKEFTGNRNKALFATFVLASLPSFMSHFIWAPALAMVVFFPTMYALEMIKHDKKWWLVSGVCFASILLAHPTHAAKLTGLIVIYISIRALFDFLADRKSWLQHNIQHLKAFALGGLLSLLWWGFKLKVFTSTATVGFKGGAEAATQAIQKSSNILVKLLTLITRMLNPESGTATRVYTLRDFVVAQSSGLINNPVGFGVVVSLLAVLGFFAAVAAIVSNLPKQKVIVAAAVLICFLSAIFIASSTLEYQNSFFAKDKDLRPQNWANPPEYFGIFVLSLVLVALIAAFILTIAAIVAGGAARQDRRLVFLAVVIGWLLFAFLGVNNKTFNLPVGLFAFRFWMVLAVPVALIAAEGLFALLGMVHRVKLGSSTAAAVKLAIIAVVVAGVFLTSAKPKYELNTSCWYPGAFWSGSFVQEPKSGCLVQSEFLAYDWLRTLPPSTKVFTFSYPDQVIGFDKYSCGWCEPEYRMRQRFFNVTSSELHSFLRGNSYDYFIIGGIEARNFNLNRTVSLINDVASSGLFTVAHQGEAAFVFKTA